MRRLRTLNQKRRTHKPSHPGRIAVKRDGYGPNWYVQRARARKRDDNTCQKCGWEGAVHVHHKRKISWFYDRRNQKIDYEKANHLDNLICLCPNCHKIADGHKKMKGFNSLVYR